MKKLFKKSTARLGSHYNKFKSWLSSKLPTFPDDVQKHFYVAYGIAFVIVMISLPFPLVGAIGLPALLLITALWEFPDLYKTRFSKGAISEATKDLTVSFIAIFPCFVLALMRYLGQ